MATILDASLGFALEGASTYGTAVTPTRFLEHSTESLDYKPNRVQGTGLRVGSRVARSSRRVTPTFEGGGSFEVEALSKGQGLLWQALMGGASSSLVSASTYQQLFTLADTLPSFTMQKGVQRIGVDASTTTDAITFLGCMASGWEISGGKELVKLSVDVDAREVKTDVAYATPSYSTGANLFHFAGAAIYSGALTAPTSTALAVGATPLAEVSEWSVKLDRGLIADRYLIGGGGRKSKPVCGEPKISGKLVVEYSSTTFRDAFLADTSMNLVINYTGGSLTTGLETLQIVVPDIRLDGELPKATAEVQKLSCGFTGLDNLTAAQPLWVVTRTSDTAL